MSLMHFAPFSRAVSRSSHRRRRPGADLAADLVAPPRRRAAMGIEVQPVHGHHCICHRCQREGTGR